MPMPSSITAIDRLPSRRTCACTDTVVSGGEKEIALSISSASVRARSLAAAPAMCALGGSMTSTRQYASTSDFAACRRLSTDVGCVALRTTSVPESTRMFSLLRRMRVTRWSSWKSLAS